MMTTNSRRDQSLEHLLRQSRAADPTSGGRSPCLDAETLAAWADGGLPPHPLAVAEAHAVECARCQAAVAVLMKQPVPVRDAVQRRRWKWGAGWLVPLAAGAAAVGVWLAVPQRTAPADEAHPGTLAMLETKTAAVPAPEPSAPADRGLPAQPPAVAGGAPAASAEQRSSAANEVAKAESADAFRRDETASGARQAEGLPRSRASASQEAVGRLAAEPAAATAAAGTAAPAAAAPVRAVVQDAAGPRQVESPDLSIRWRIGAGGSVEVSADAGLSWQPQASGVTADLTAGSAPASSVCWLVGRAGAVLRTSDGGRTWLRVVFPQTLDLVAVEATDALTATVTASGGRIFRTIDAGGTWH